MVDKVRISGENLFRPEMVYSLHGSTNYPPDLLGLVQPSTTATKNISDSYEAWPCKRIKMRRIVLSETVGKE